MVRGPGLYGRWKLNLSNALSVNLAKTSLGCPLGDKEALKTQPSLLEELSEQERGMLEDGYCRRMIKRRFFQWASDQAKGKRIDWAAVSAALAQRTGVVIPKDSLRQNFQPSNRKQGKPPRDFREPERWAALYRFLISDAVGYLRPEELSQKMLPVAGLASLQDFLSSTQDALPKSLKGRFTSLLSEEQDAESTVTLDIDFPATSGVLRAALHEEIEPLENPDLGFTRIYDGALIGHPQFMVFVFRDRVTATPKLCLIGQTNPPMDQSETVENIALWAYEGISVNELKIAATTHEVEGQTDVSVSHMNYRFDGRMATYFLTRC